MKQMHQEKQKPANFQPKFHCVPEAQLHPFCGLGKSPSLLSSTLPQLAQVVLLLQPKDFSLISEKELDSRSSSQSSKPCHCPTLV